MTWQVEQATEPSQAPEGGNERTRFCDDDTEIRRRLLNGDHRWKMSHDLVLRSIGNDHAPSRSISYSWAMARISSPSLASTVFSKFPLESLKWTLMLRTSPTKLEG